VSTGSIDLSGFEHIFDIHQYRRSRRLSATSGRLKFGKGRPRRGAKVGNPLPRPLLWTKLLALTTYTGRDKFAANRHDKIQEYSKTLTGAVNAGGKHRHAEALLWAKEDKASWEAAAIDEEGIDWVE
jgi:hypothetical protein